MNQELAKLCLESNLEDASKLVSSFTPEEKEKIKVKSLFKKCCNANAIQSLHWILRTFKNVTLSSHFKDISDRSNHFKNIFISLLNADHDLTDFDHSCFLGCFYFNESTDLLDNLISIIDYQAISNQDINDVFFDLCYNTNYDSVKWILDNSNLEPMINPDYEVIVNGTYNDFKMTGLEAINYNLSLIQDKMGSYEKWLKEAAVFDLFYSTKKSENYYTIEKYKQEQTILNSSFKNINKLLGLLNNYPKFKNCKTQEFRGALKL